MGGRPSSAIFSTARKCVKLSGLILTKSISTREIVYCCLLLFFLYFQAVIMCCKVFEGFDVTDVNEIIPTLGYMNVIPRMTVIRWHRAKLADILAMLEEINVSSHKGGRKQIDSLKKFSKLVISLFIMPCLVGLAIVVWYITRATPLPFGLTPNWALNFSFTGCLILQLATYPFIGHEYITEDCLKVTILLQLRKHFKNLRENIRNLMENGRQLWHEEMEGPVPWEYLREEMRKVNEYWNVLNEICQKTEDVFNLCVLSTVINYSFYLCTIYFGLSKVPLFGVDFWLMIAYLKAPSLLLICDCFLTQLVITESEEVADTCCEIDFVGTDLRFQKALMYMIRKAHRPVKFTIGKFAPYSIVTIVVIAKVSFSYFSFLKNVS